MLSKKSQIFLFFIITIILGKIFPIIDNIEESERSEIKSVNIESIEEYINYIKNYEDIFSLFHVDWCEHCQQFLPILDEASSYKILNKKWIFLKIDCSKYQNICSFLNIQRYPTIKIYREKEQLYIESPRDLKHLLQLLYKLSSNPIIKINHNNKTEFFEKYGNFSPIIEVLPKNNNEQNEKSDFFHCINNLANKEFIQTFYFGILESKDNIEKIYFTYNELNISYIWDGKCKNAFNFLYDNKYPLISKIDNFFLKEISADSKILIFLMAFPQNIKIHNFIFSFFIKLSFEYRQIVFGYTDYNEDKNIPNFFKLKLNDKNEIKLIIYDFNERMHYIHNETFNVKTKNEMEIFNEIKNVIKNINNLKYTTGSMVKDWASKIGFEKMSSEKKIVVIGIFIVIIIGISFFSAYFSNNNVSLNSSEEDDDVDEEIQQDNKLNNSKNRLDKIKNISDKEKIE